VRLESLTYFLAGVIIDSEARQRVGVKGIVGFRVMHNDRVVREPGRPGDAEEFDLEPVLVAGVSGYPGG
ncbi:MAG: hypothetical protein ACLQU5_06250, partial [Isosphaeraceae bacterium]